MWIRNFFIKPKLTVVPGSQIEIGFTTFGPIINLSLTDLSVSKKTLFEKIELELVNENNATQKFSWVLFEKHCIQ